MFCMNCGQQLPDGAKFCFNCGNAMGAVEQPATPPPVPTETAHPPIPTEEDSNPKEREQEYIGSIQKCPSCGAALKSMDAICPECGMEINNRKASSAVSNFAKKLESINEDKVESAAGKFLKDVKGVFKTNKTKTKEKIEAIKTFPIPNTVEEITEFVVMASSNIDVSLSKKSFFSAQPGVDENKDISDAWVSKLQQAYDKAKLSFGNDPGFKKIEEIYENKMIELKMIKKK